MKGKLGLLVLMLVALVLAVTLLGCGSDAGTQASVSDQEKAAIQKLIAAHLSDKEADMADVFAEDAVLVDQMGGTVVEGRDKVVAYIGEFPTLDWQAAGDPFKVGSYVVQPVALWAEGERAGLGTHIYDIDKDGKIARFWVTVTSIEG